MVQLNGINGNVGQAIPLYQKGFNWIKYWLGFLFGCCLCLLFAAAVTFLILYILAQAGAIRSIRNSTSGRMIPPNGMVLKEELTNKYAYPVNLVRKEATEKKCCNDILREKLLKETSKTNFKDPAA